MSDEKQIIEDMARAIATAMGYDPDDKSVTWHGSEYEHYPIWKDYDAEARAAFAVCKAALSLDGLSERKESEDNPHDWRDMVARGLGAGDPPSAPAPVQAGMVTVSDLRARLTAAQEENARELHMIRRGLEMSANIMRDTHRTGGWEGAERVARSFERYAQRLAALSPAPQPKEPSP